MPRTLNATLEAALNSGSFQPYFLLTVREAGTVNIVETAQPTYFKLSGINLVATWVNRAGDTYAGFSKLEELEFKITRGVTVAGVNYTIDSSYYYGTRQLWDGTFQTIEACMLPAIRYTAAADVTYETVIDAICTEFGKTAVYRDDNADWLDYQFLGDGKTITLNRASDITNWLKQKYLIFACDNGGDEILFSAIGTETHATQDHIIPMGLFKDFSPDIASRRQFLYRDEANTIHYSGNTEDPLWNLGYLESTASPPTKTLSFPLILTPIAPHLKYLSLDFIRFTFAANYPDTELIAVTLQVDMEEEYNYKLKEIGWRLNLRSYDWAKGTEGGALPGTIEAAAPYTPLNTSSFDGILSDEDNNIQAAMETLDDHEHDTGVTNGDDHDHVGGDGAPISYTTVIPTFLNGATVPASTTHYTCPFKDTTNTTQNNFPWPEAGTLKNLSFRVSLTQPASGSLVLTLMVNNVDTALTVTVPAGSGVGTYTDSTHTVNISAGDDLKWKIQNNATSTSMAQTAIMMTITKTTI